MTTGLVAAMLVLLTGGVYGQAEDDEPAQMVFDATLSREFKELPRLDVVYHADLTDRSGKFMTRALQGVVLDTVQLDRRALHNATRHDEERVALTVRQVVAQAEWIQKAGGVPRYYNAIPMSGHYNLIRMDLEAFNKKVIDPIKPMLEALPVLDTPNYFKDDWYREFDQRWASIEKVADELAALGKKLDKPIAVWLWASRYSEEKHLERHTAYLTSVGLQVVYWDKKQEEREKEDIESDEAG
ncbi:MAG: hypothetical protein AAGB26_15215 [Planctomycetota bacterium]